MENLNSTEKIYDLFVKMENTNNITGVQNEY